MIEAVEKLIGISNFLGRVTPLNGIHFDDNHDWGYQVRVINNELYCVKFLVLTNFEKGSWHYHREKDESWVILQGELNTMFDLRKLQTYAAGQELRITPMQSHQMWAKSLPCVILEVSTHDDDNDIIYVDKEQKGDK